MRKRKSVIERGAEFRQLSKEQQIEARLVWLEQSTFDLLWTVVRISGFFGAGVVAYAMTKLLGEQAHWYFVLPPTVIAFFVAGWVVERQAFRHAPPHIDFLDTRL